MGGTRRWLRGEEGVEVVGGQFLHDGGVGGGDGRGDDGLFAALEFQHLLLDGVGGNHLHDVDDLLLADAVRAVCGLVFDCGVPPGVVVDYHVGACEVETGAAGHEGNEEHRD